MSSFAAFDKLRMASEDEILKSENGKWSTVKPQSILSAVIGQKSMEISSSIIDHCPIHLGRRSKHFSPGRRSETIFLISEALVLIWRAHPLQLGDH